MKPHRILLMVLVVALCGCAGMWGSLKSAAAPASGGAVGAAVGSLAGPVGTIGGAAVGAMAGDMFEENASLRSGETIGEGALDKQVDRWALDYFKERGARIAAKSGEAVYRSWFWRALWVAAGAIALFVFVRRKYLGKAVTGKAVENRFWTLIHAFSGSDWTRKLAFGFDPIPKNLPTQADKEVIVARLEKSA